jgi:hypothetical protein
MGNSFVAVANDVNTIAYNPAGVGIIEHKEISTMYGKLYWGLSDAADIADGFLGYAHPLKRWGVGVGYIWRFVSSYYREESIILAIGKQIILNPYSFPLCVGMDIRAKQKVYRLDKWTENDPLLKEVNAKKGFAVDFGCLYRFDRRINIGISIKDLFSSDMGLEEECRVPTEVRLGASYKLFHLDETDTSSVSLDLSFQKKQTKMFLGTENWLVRNILCLRAGLGVGNYGYNAYSTGFGIRVPQNLQVDYAWVLPTGARAQTSGSHRMSITIRFGKNNEE